MLWTPTLYTVLGVIAAVISIGFAAVAVQHDSKPYAETFVALMIAVAAWSLVYGVQLGFSELRFQLVWQRSALAVSGTVPTLWLVFAAQYAGVDEWLTSRRLRLLAVEPAVFALLTLTNHLHGLVWQSGSLLVEAGVPVVRLVLQPAYYVHISYAYLVIAAGVILLGGVALRGSVVYRKQAAFLMAGTLPPSLANIAFTLDRSPIPELDATPFAFVLTGTFWGLALFQFDLLDRIPVARRRVIRDTGVGVVILDANNTVVEVTGPAPEVFDPTPTVGDTAGGLRALDGETQTTVIDGQRRVFDVTVSPLTERDDHHAGSVVVAHDVTDRDQYEQRLEVANRVLRHNLANDTNVIVGHAQKLQRLVDDGTAVDSIRAIRDAGHRLATTSEKARTITQLSPDATDPDAIDLCPPTREVVEEFRRSHPAVSFGLNTPEAAVAVVGSADRYRAALRNLIENAIVHHDRGRTKRESGSDDAPHDESTATTPQINVTLAVDETASRVDVTVSDDGPGIPEMERAVFRTGSETDLRHGSGLGLWLVYWAVTSVGGELSFADRDPRGSRVTLSYRRPDRRDRRP